MKIGFDYWQVISHYPKHIKELIGSLENNANDTYIISAVGKNRIGTVAAEIKKIPEFSRFSDRYIKDRVHEVIFDHPRESPELKVALALELGLDMVS